MQSIMIACLGLLAGFSGWAQRGVDPDMPPFGQEKVSRLIAEARAKDKTFGPGRLSDSVYKSLSLQEKFTYNLIHPESFYQNCGLMSNPNDPRTIQARLSADIWGVATWSSRQYDFFSANRDTVVALMRLSLGTRDEVTVDYLKLMEVTHATEMIPFLLRVYRVHDHHAILTLLAELMKDRDYSPFTDTPLAKALYGPTTSYRTEVPFTRAAQRVILDNAGNFYNSIRKK